MIIEKNVLSELVQKYIESNCAKDTKVNDKLKFKTYLKKDDNDNFVVIDKEHSIKCLFDKKYMELYFSTYPSYTSLDQYDGMLIMIMKASFDVLFFKNINKTLTYRVVLCVLEFELDNAQKMSIENYTSQYPNVNLVPKIEEKLNAFYYNFIRTKTHSQNDANALSSHLLINAGTFIKKQFNTVNRTYCSVIKVLPNKCSLTLMHNAKDQFTFINDDDNKVSTIREIGVKNGQMLKDNYNIVDDNINIETLKVLDCKTALYKQSALELASASASIEKLHKITSTNQKSLGNKRERAVDIDNTLPINIRNLIYKMENRPLITIGLLEKYKQNKKFSIGEYTKEAY